MAIFELCVQHSIKLETDLTPSSLNTWADFLSRIVDYGVDSCIFDALEASWGPHSINYFASSYSTLLSCFIVGFGCEAVDIFTVSCDNELNWWVPPLHLICRTIRRAAQCRAKGTLIIPAWKSEPFGLLFAQMGNTLLLLSISGHPWYFTPQCSRMVGVVATWVIEP